VQASASSTLSITFLPLFTKVSLLTTNFFIVANLDFLRYLRRTYFGRGIFRIFFCVPPQSIFSSHSNCSPQIKRECAIWLVRPPPPSFWYLNYLCPFLTCLYFMSDIDHMIDKFHKDNFCKLQPTNFFAFRRLHFFSFDE